MHWSSKRPCLYYQYVRIDVTVRWSLAIPWLLHIASKAGADKEGGMKERLITESGVAADVVEALEQDVVMVQLPTVFALLAPATKEGVRWLDRTKSRLPNKNYGTAIGDLRPFYALAKPGALPLELDSLEGLKLLTGAFIRIAVAPTTFNSPIVRNGTHQGLLLEGPHRDLFKEVEAGQTDTAEPGLLNGQTFTAPLCTSANISGHPEGSITSWEKAYAFGVERNVPLVVRCESVPRAMGSYPVFWLQRNGVRIERAGPGVDELKATLPARLFNAA
jgi:tRNA A37 threonylcarbamoyladenosine synthetase subunit TsaC/SUA5/YrdC